MSEQRTCEERIDAELAGRVEAISLLVRASNYGATVEDFEDDERAMLDALGLDLSDEIDNEQAQQLLDELPFDVSVKTICTVLLSTGGPADMFEFEVEDGRIESNITYRFQDWFDGATRTGGLTFEVEGWLEHIAEYVSLRGSE